MLPDGGGCAGAAVLWVNPNIEGFSVGGDGGAWGLFANAETVDCGGAKVGAKGLREDGCAGAVTAFP